MSDPEARRIAAILKRVIGRIAGQRGPRRDDQAPAEERRREPRFRVEFDPGSTDEVVVTFPTFDEVHPVSNLSLRGFAFSARLPPEELPAQGRPCEANVLVGGLYVPVRLVLLHAHGGEVGCRILEARPEWTEEVSKLICPRRLGEGLREREAPPPESDGGRLRWFSSGPACDLFVHDDAAGVHQRIQLIFTWQLVEWSREDGVRTGVAEAPPLRDPGIDVAGQFIFSSPPDLEALAFARTLLAYAEVDDGIRDPFQEANRRPI